MNRLKAPENPEPRQPYFYIMRDKEIFGLPQDNGKGVQFIYADCGRLINCAKITGNITQQDVLDLMKTTEGFRKLVHSIGVSIVTHNPKEKVNFIFQMYGRRDRCHGGTDIVSSMCGDGMETIVNLSQIEWSEDDCKVAAESGKYCKNRKSPQEGGKRRGCHDSFYRAVQYRQ